MMNDNRVFARTWHGLAAALVPAYVAFMTVACSGKSSDVGGVGIGGASSSGGSISGGASNSGGSVSGGTQGVGGSQLPSNGGATGGSKASGGSSQVDPGQGGIGQGGAAATGGAAVTGGAASTTGGANASGAPSTGGARAGGASSTGGARTGGAPSTGGSSSVGIGGSTSGGSGTGGGSSSAVGGGTSDAVKSAGCGKTSTVTFASIPGEPPNGFGTGGYVTINGRSFAMRLPDNYDNTKPYWLVFGFHWMGGTSAQVDSGGSNGYSMAHFGLQALSKNGAIFVAPQGNGGGWGNSGGADLKFVDDMVKLIEDNYCVDTTRLYANGFSYGGGMSYAIACARAKVFRAVAIYNGAVLSGCDGGTDPIAYWQMAGLTDTTCTVAAATPMRNKFVTNNGCTAQTPPQPPAPPPYLATGGHVCTTYSGCSSGHPVRWCVHQSGHGNAIVDGTADLYNSCATPPKTCSATCPCSWVPEDVWSFFTSL